MSSTAARPSSRTRILIPKEHGAWAVLLMPYIVATGIAGGPSASGLLFLCAAVCCFAARYPLALALDGPRKGRGESAQAIAWTAIYATLAAVSGLALVFIFERWFLLALALIALALMGVQHALRTARLDRTAAGELLAFAGLSLTGPGAYYAVSGRLDTTAGSIWLLSFLYAGAAIFYVKLRVKQRIQRASQLNLLSRLKLGAGLALYQGFSLALVILLAAGNHIPPLAPISFAPLAFKAAHYILAAPRQLSLRRLGFVEVGHSLAFTALLIGAYAL